mgnify:CR=1 FL=1|jgi:glutaminyl-tRNA synthetase
MTERTFYPQDFFDNIPESGEVITRFPPEPNGYLHLGHVKAMEIDFDFAKINNGKCILRYDDTNPLAEHGEFYDNIREDVEWLGYNYCKITYTSDYFDELFNYAIQLINQGDAYICQLSPDDIKSYRNQKIESPYKNRSIEESLSLFENMKNGQYDEGDMTLRMKGDLNDNNSTMWDVIMYRIIKSSHHRTGDKWVIYPTYDFSHCIVDSIENITHSFCTTEYIIRRAQYFWFLDKLKLRKPYVFEFSRLEVENAILSKRKVKELINTHNMSGWNDPRLFTIKGLRRRGYTPASLIELCRNGGVTKVESELTTLLMENIIRNHLNLISVRRFAVMNPLKLIIDNWPHVDNKPNEFIDCYANDFPFDNGGKDRCMRLTKELYIDKLNFKEVDEKSFYGLAPGKTIRLKYGHFVSFNNYDKENNVVHVNLACPEKPKKIKGILNWVGSDYKNIIIRTFNGNDMTEIKCMGESSLTESSLTESSLTESSNSSFMCQFEKYGFYCVDQSSLDQNKLIFNETVKLKTTYN